MIRRLLGALSPARRNRDELVGMNRRNVELVYPLNPRAHYPIADDKLLGKQTLAAAGVPVPESLATCEGLFAIPGVIDRLAGDERFVVKPASGSGGDGILVVGDRGDGPSWSMPGGARLFAHDLHRHLANIVFGAYSKQLEDRAFVERRVEQHPDLAVLCAGGICDIRVIAVEGTPVMAMARVPTVRSGGRANLHQGGVGLALDLETGVTTRAVIRRRSIAAHPDTGAALLGVQLPHWAEVVEVARAAAAAVPLQFLGVDVVIDIDRGPLVLEINARPGIEIQNVHRSGLGRALAEAAL